MALSLKAIDLKHSSFDSAYRALSNALVFKPIGLKLADLVFRPEGLTLVKYGFFVTS